MANSGLYMGNALQGVDAKGRVAIPARFRDVIVRNADAADASTIIVKRHPELPCLQAFDMSWTHLHHARLDDREVAAEDGSAIKRQIERDLGGLDTPQFDAAGRFFLNPMLKRRAGIVDLAFFAGAGRTFNIWAPEKLLAHDDVDEDTRDWCEYHMELRAGRA